MKKKQTDQTPFQSNQAKPKSFDQLVTTHARSEAAKKGHKQKKK